MCEVDDPNMQHTHHPYHSPHPAPLRVHGGLYIRVLAEGTQCFVKVDPHFLTISLLSAL